MDNLPLVLENIILDYKHQLEHTCKFKPVLDDIKTIYNDEFGNKYPLKDDIFINHKGRFKHVLLYNKGFEGVSYINNQSYISFVRYLTIIGCNMETGYDGANYDYFR